MSSPQLSKYHNWFGIKGVLCHNLADWLKTSARTHTHEGQIEALRRDDGQTLSENFSHCGYCLFALAPKGESCSDNKGTKRNAFNLWKWLETFSSLEDPKYRQGDWEVIQLGTLCIKKSTHSGKLQKNTQYKAAIRCEVSVLLTICVNTNTDSGEGIKPIANGAKCRLIEMCHQGETLKHQSDSALCAAIQRQK